MSTPPFSRSEGDPTATLSTLEGQAAAWIVRRQAGWSNADEFKFQAWLASDPRCAAVLADLEDAWEIISHPGNTGEPTAALVELQAIRRARRRRGVTIASIGLAAGLAVLVVGLSKKPSSLTAAPAAEMVAVRPDRQVLPDDSVVERNARTDIEVDYSPQERRVRLLRGEALFTVAHDAARPFFVVAGEVQIRAVGTEFSVRRDPREIDVLVTQGEVAVTQIAPDPAGDVAVLAVATSPIARLVHVVAGRRVVMASDLPHSAVPEARPVAEKDIAAALAWRGKRIEFTRAPLSEVTGLFNRQNQLQLAVGDGATGALQITGIFWSDDPEGLVRLLGSGFNVAAERSDDLIKLRQSL